ncbi:hypothetical protein HRbin01_01033 [archaeon HR01]|nr:hypothetical protein HRbin01_01033 [archaeon HR01]
MPCPKCKSGDIVEMGDEIECLNCGFRWRRFVSKRVKPTPPVKTRARPLSFGGGGLLASIGYGAAIYLGLAVGYSLIIYAARTLFFGSALGDGGGDMAAALGAIIIFIAISLNLLLAGPIIAAVVGVFMGIRHRGGLLLPIIATLISSIAGYLLLFMVVTYVFVQMLPQPDTAQQQIGGEFLILIIPQAVVGTITSALAAKALARG